MPNSRALGVAYLLTLLTVGHLAAADEDRGVIFYERFLGSTNTLGNVFRLLADVGHVNIVIAGEVTGTVTLRLVHVPWDQALDVVATAKQLDVERDGNVILITPRKH